MLRAGPVRDDDQRGLGVVRLKSAHLLNNQAIGRDGCHRVTISARACQNPSADEICGLRPGDRLLVVGTDIARRLQQRYLDEPRLKAQLK